MEMNSTQYKKKSVVAERCIGILKNKVYKCLNSVSKDVYIDKLDDIINKYKNTYHITTKMKHVDGNSNTYIDCSKGINDEDWFKNGDIIRISKSIFAKGYLPNWCEEVIVIKRVKNTVPWTYIISDLKG